MAVYIVWLREAGGTVAGKKLGLFGSIATDNVEALGAITVAMPPGALYSALKSGSMDAVAVGSAADRDALLVRFGRDGIATDAAGAADPVTSAGSVLPVATGDTNVVAFREPGRRSRDACATEAGGRCPCPEDHRFKRENRSRPDAGGRRQCELRDHGTSGPRAGEAAARVIRGTVTFADVDADDFVF